MADDVRANPKAQRAEARERRRSLAAEQFENVDRQAREQEQRTTSGSP